MTSGRLVAAFQPLLLSRPTSEMSAEDHTRAAETMVFMVENQDNFLIGMGIIAGTDKKPAAETQTKPEIRREKLRSDGGAGFARLGSSAP